MSVIEQIVAIVGGSGGPNGNAIPVYADNKAPGGAQVIGPNGKQLMLENSEISGVRYIIVNPSLVSPTENQGSKFVTWKPDGKPNYVRLWIRNPETGAGDDYAGFAMWIEYSHLKPIEQEAPQPPPVTPSNKRTFRLVADITIEEI